MGDGREQVGGKGGEKEEEGSFSRNSRFPKTVLKSPAIDNIILNLFLHRQGMTFTAGYHTLTTCVKILLNDAEVLDNSPSLPQRVIHTLKHKFPDSWNISLGGGSPNP